MKTLFDKTNLGTINMKNRFLRGALWTALSYDK